MPIKAPAAQPADSWTGAYFGGHFGWGVSSLGVATNPVAGAAFDLPSVRSSGMLAGLHLGYNHQLANRVVVGLEADLTFADLFARRAVTETVGGQTSQLIANLHYFGTARARIGYAFDRYLPYVTGGLAWSRNRIENDFADGTATTKTLMQLGWTIGAGLEYSIGANWSARAEYNYIDFGPMPYGGLFLDEMARATGTFDQKIHAFKLGLTYRVTDAGGRISWPPAADLGDWSIHGQSTFIGQGYPAFHSAIPDGPNSLTRARQAKETMTATAFVGRKLWEGGEIYFDPEINQGFGLSETTGLAAYPNGEAQKSNFPVPRPNVARLYLRQTFGFGGEQETVEDAANQIAGKRDISRLTVTVGKFAIADFFNFNTYANDPRSQFFNWALWGAGAFDYAADQVGLTWGGFVELNQKDWAVRAGYFLIPVVSNVSRFDHAPRGQYMAELEERYSLLGQPGKLRFLAWLSHANMGNYADAVGLAAMTAGVPDLALTRRLRDTYGFVVNAEQAVSDDLGVFSRVSWNAGRDEIMALTDSNASFSLGVVLKGTTWGRPADRIGVAGVIDGLSGDARAYFAAGGIGILIGDGQLTYRPEQILEAYYAIGLDKWTTLTFDWQLVVNPAYNADRGPVSIYATRLHVEF